MKAMISAATNSFDDVVYLMEFSRQKEPGTMAGQIGDNVAVHSHPIASS